MAAITTTAPIELTGIGELAAGVKVSFKANFLEREQGVVCHSVWYKDQTNFNSGTEIKADIDGLVGGKDNIMIGMDEFSQAELAIIAQATEIMQEKVMAKLGERMNNSNLFVIA